MRSGNQRSTMANFYAASDVIVVASLYEPMGYVVLEAMASGRAVVASNTGGIRELIIHGKTGLLYEPGNVNERAAHLLLLMSDSCLQKKLGAKARSVIKERENPKICVQQKLDAIYRQVAFGLSPGSGQGNVLGELPRSVDDLYRRQMEGRTRISVHDTAIVGCRIASELLAKGDASENCRFDEEVYKAVASIVHSMLRRNAVVIAFSAKVLYEMMADLASAFLGTDKADTAPILISGERTRERLREARLD